MEDTPKSVWARWIWLTVLLIALPLAGCGAPPTASPPAVVPTESPAATMIPSPTAPRSPTPSSSLQGTVAIWLDWSPAELAGLQQAIQRFRQAHPRVEFELVYVPSDGLRPAFEEAAAVGEGPTLLFGPAEWGPGLFLAERIQDPSGSLLPGLRETLHPLAWSQVSYRGITVGLPLEFHGVVLYRNASLAPETPDSVEELVEQAAALRGGDLVGAALDFGFLFSGAQLSPCESRFFDSAGQFILPGDEGICWLNLLRTLGGSGPSVFNSDEDLNFFLAGRSAWLIDTTHRLDAIRQALGNTVAQIDPWPLYPPSGGVLTGYVWSENVYFNAAARGPDLEAAVAFVTFLLLPDTQRLLSDPAGARHLPVALDLEIDDPLLARALQVVRGGQPRPLALDLDAYRSPLLTAVRLVVAGGGEPELALQLAVQEILSGTGTPTPTASATRTPSSTPTPTRTLTPSP